MAYVSVSRGQWDAQIFTNNREKLAQALSHDVSHKSAFRPEKAISAMTQKIGPASERVLERSIGYGWDCKQNDFFIKGADDAGSQHRKQEAISTSHHSARGEAAGKPGRSGPAFVH
jgi:hypothetical protein